MIDWKEFYAVSAIFQPCNGGKKLVFTDNNLYTCSFRATVLVKCPEPRIPNSTLSMGMIFFYISCVVIHYNMTQKPLIWLTCFDFFFRNVKITVWSLTSACHSVAFSGTECSLKGQRKGRSGIFTIGRIYLLKLLANATQMTTTIVHSEHIPLNHLFWIVAWKWN